MEAKRSKTGGKDRRSDAEKDEMTLVVHTRTVLCHVTGLQMLYNASFQIPLPQNIGPKIYNCPLYEIHDQSIALHILADCPVVL